MDAAEEQLEEIRAAIGSLPDVGASRAAAILGRRFGIEGLDYAVVWELARTDAIPAVGEFKGHPLYCGRALEAFHDRKLLERARQSGELLQVVGVARYLAVRRSDVMHLVRSRWLRPTSWAYSYYQPKKWGPQVALYRRGDLDVLLTHPAIYWDEVRATPRGRPSDRVSGPAVPATATESRRPGR
ncbi:hypothetical protein [Streptomyces sp. NPDC048489]|uniref:hypothetical protein n=1 Tax=Streptomyces sp. NPDC048489 TaxID=3154504 RepID=UPI003437E265